MKTIALNGDYGYLEQIETTIKSIIFHNQKNKIYVINPDIPHEWFVNLNQYLQQIGSQVIDAKVDSERLQKMRPSFSHISNVSFGRLLIPELVEEDKVLYLDCDLVVDSSLDELFQMDFEDKMFFAVKDYRASSEFNAGVMLINNRKWKEDHVVESLIERAQNPNLQNGDQTVLNDFFHGRIGQLDLSYNYQIGFDSAAFWGKWDKTLKILESVKNPRIIHYVTADKPFKLVSSVSLREKWWNYRNLEWSELISKYTKFEREKIKELTFSGEVFMFTNLAETQDLEKLIRKLPNVRFNIAAYTFMSFLLVDLTKYDNVRIYPTIIGKTLDKLIDQADIYLDVNYGPKENEVIDRIVRKNIPIYSFEQTMSQNLNYDNYHVFQDGQVDEMVDAIKKELHIYI